MHCVRVLLVFSLALALRFSSEQRSLKFSPTEGEVRSIAIDDVLPLLPTAIDLGEPDAQGIQSVLDAEGETIAHVLQTSPQADSVIGYRGPSNTVIVLRDGIVADVRVANSEDTPDHAQAVMQDAALAAQFEGWAINRANPAWEVDGTSGATLTSLAVADAVALRLLDESEGPRTGSLKFPDEFDQRDLLDVFGSDAKLRPVGKGPSAEVIVEHNNGQKTGKLIRTGPLVDTIAGYQGPSEITLAVDDTGSVLGMALRRTYDNEPYVDYVREESYFWETFIGKTLDELAAFDPQASGVEGVSGATMTSLTVADTVVAAAIEYKAREQRKIDAEIAAQQRKRIRWTWHDFGTGLVLVFAIAIGMTRLRSIRWLRTTWLIVLVVYFGLMTGNLVSQAILMGWSSSGIAWKLAPGLAAVLLIALTFPATSKTNLYCSHVCPHGAIQQLLIRRLPWRLRPGKRTSRTMSYVPGTLLVAAFIVSLIGLGWNLANWEPFNAYIWYISGTASIALAIGSLIVSAMLPMAYCRFGCPTGRLLDYLRFNAASGSLTFADAMCFTLAVSSWTWIAFQ